jgi:predicted transcriptional regulator
MRNKKKGIEARSMILKTLETKSYSTKDLLKNTNLHYSALLYHLKLLEKNKLIKRKAESKKLTLWEKTGLGQQSINIRQ